MNSSCNISCVENWKVSGFTLESSSSFFSAISKERTSLRNALGVKNACHLKLRPVLAEDYVQCERNEVFAAFWQRRHQHPATSIRWHQMLFFLENTKALNYLKPAKKINLLDFAKHLQWHYLPFIYFWLSKIHLCINDEMNAFLL